MCISTQRSAAAPRRHPGLPLGAALALCVAGQVVEAASRPYLTVSQPMEMRQAPPRVMASRIIPQPITEPAEVAPAAEATEKPAAETASTATSAGETKLPASLSTTPVVKPSTLAPEPPLELVPDGTGGLRPAMLEDFLPYFQPPGPPQSRATYEQK